MEQSVSFEFRIVGNELTPETLRLTDLAAVIAELEKAIAPVISRDSPEVAENVIISLKSVEDGSAKLKLFSRNFVAAQAAFIVLALAVKEKTFAKLPEESVKSLHSLRQLSRKKNWTFEFRKDPRRKLPLAQITPLSSIEQASRTIKGFTTVYGQIIRTGGIQPKVLIQLLDGSLLSCDVEKTMAISLGSRLYASGRFNGEATWDLEAGYRMTDFRITQASDFVQASIQQAFAGLSQQIGEYFRDVDPDEYASNQRREN